MARSHIYLTALALVYGCSAGTGNPTGAAKSDNPDIVTESASGPLEDGALRGMFCEDLSQKFNVKVDDCLLFGFERIETTRATRYFYRDDDDQQTEVLAGVRVRISDGTRTFHGEARSGFTDSFHLGWVKAVVDQTGSTGTSDDTYVKQIAEELGEDFVGADYPEVLVDAEQSDIEPDEQVQERVLETMQQMFPIDFERGLLFQIEEAYVILNEGAFAGMLFRAEVYDQEELVRGANVYFDPTGEFVVQTNWPRP